MEVLAWAIARLNRAGSWSELGGFYPIYLLLEAVFFETIEEGNFRAETGRVRYRARRGRATPQTPTVDEVRALSNISDAQRLWAVDCKLMSVFDLRIRPKRL